MKLRPRCAWDLDTGRLVGNSPFALFGDTPDDKLDDARPNDKRLDLEPLTVLLSESGSLQVHDLRNRRVVSTLKHAATPLRSWQFYQDFALLLIGEDNVARVFDPMTGEPLSTVSASGRKVGKASLASQGKRLFIEWSDPFSDDSRKPNLDLYDAATGKPIKSYAIGYGHAYVSERRNFAVIPTVASTDSGEKGPMQVLDAATGEKIYDISFWHSDLRVRDVSEDGRLVFLTTNYRKPADGNSLVVDFEFNRVVAALPTDIISDGGLI